MNQVSPIPQLPPVVRQLGALEQWLLLMDQNRPNHFSVTAAISGETTPALWRAALDQLCLRHPLLNVCIEKEADSTFTFRRAAQASIPLVVLQRSSSTQWQEEAKQELGTVFIHPAHPSRARCFSSETVYVNSCCRYITRSPMVYPPPSSSATSC